MIDLVIEEVSLVESYRAQFTKVLKKEGFAGLVKKMKEKIDAGTRASAGCCCAACISPSSMRPTACWWMKRAHR